jgi:hypothetical protein
MLTLYPARTSDWHSFAKIRSSVASCAEVSMQTDLPRPDAQLKPAVVVKTFIEEPLQMCEAKVEYHCRNLLDARIPCRVEIFPVIACDRVSRKHRQQTVLVAKLQARHSLPGLYGLQVILRSVAEPTVSVVPEHFLSGGKRQLFSTGEGLAQNCCCGKTHSSNHLHDRTE